VGLHDAVRSRTRYRVVLAIGLAMMALGAYIALRPLWAGPRPMSSSRWIDMAFAAFFLVRGLMNVQGARRALARMEAP
jgi:hypothetical protein